MRFVLIILALLGLSSAQAKAPTSGDYFENGFFSLAGCLGLGQYKFLNEDGTYAGYNSYLFGMDLDVNLFPVNSAQVRLYVSYLMRKGENSNLSSDTLNGSETTFGIKVYPVKYFYVMAGYGRGQVKLDSDSRADRLSVSHPITSIGVGLELSISESLSVGTQFTFKNGPLIKADNQGLQRNSYFESYDVLLRLIWSPPSTSITYSNSSR